jgi:hypothetical protein
MLLSQLGDAGKLADLETIKQKVLGSRYMMNFSGGVNFDMDVVTSDAITATTLAVLVNAGVLYRKLTTTAIEKLALDSFKVGSDGPNLQMHFKSEDKQFRELMHSPLFAALSK